MGPQQLTRGQFLHSFQTEVTDIPTFPQLPLGSIDNGSCGLYTNLILRSQGSTFLLPRFHPFRHQMLPRVFRQVRIRAAP
jgi:hypothetical protein